LYFHEKKEGMYLVSTTPPKQRVGLVQNGHHHYILLIKIKLVVAMIWLKYFSLGLQQKSLIHSLNKITITTEWCVSSS
jgi:hypothetical protein